VTFDFQRTPGADHRLLSPRLELRPVTPDDLADLQSLYGDPAVRRQLWGGAAFDDLHTDGAIRQSLRSFRAHGYGTWRLGSRRDGRFVGCCGLNEIGAEAELLVAIEPALHRSGYAREAALTVLNHALRRLRLHRVVAMCATDDAPARALLAALGMREQHVTRASGFDHTVDVVLHEITLSDLPAPAPPVPLMPRREA
jgi:ribosomal-protein-alanine N-acetyltransferase